MSECKVTGGNPDINENLSIFVTLNNNIKITIIRSCKFDQP
jgi:hypothetical protein